MSTKPESGWTLQHQPQEIAFEIPYSHFVEETHLFELPIPKGATDDFLAGVAFVLNELEADGTAWSLDNEQVGWFR